VWTKASRSQMSNNATLLQIRRAVENEIRPAFRGITLGRGISLRQAQFADGLRDAVRHAHSASPAHQEINDDWSRVSLDELERDGIAHLDALGFRYYIPALMVSVLNHYDSSSMRVIGTLPGLYPRKIIAGTIICIAILSSTLRIKQPSHVFSRNSRNWSSLTLRVRRSWSAPCAIIGENTCKRMRPVKERAIDDVSAVKTVDGQETVSDW
jgi:hypothetical protein